MREYSQVFLLSVLLLLPACNPPDSGSSSSGPVTQPSGFVATAPFTTSLSDYRHRAPLSADGRCSPGSNVDVGRTLTGTVTATLGDVGPTTVLAAGVRDIGVTVPDGVYTWSNRPLTANCEPADPIAGPFTATFSITYRGEVDQENQPQVCVFRSRSDFSSFTVTGIDMLDDVIQENVKGEAHRGVDREVADRISQFVRSAAFPSSAQPRCDDWSELPG